MAKEVHIRPGSPLARRGTVKDCYPRRRQTQLLFQECTHQLCSRAITSQCKHPNVIKSAEQGAASAPPLRLMHCERLSPAPTAAVASFRSSRQCAAHGEQGQAEDAPSAQHPLARRTRANKRGESVLCRAGLVQKSTVGCDNRFHACSAPKARGLHTVEAKNGGH